MDIKKLQSTVVAALEDIKAQDIRVYDTVHLTSLFDRIAIASGTSNRQTKALAASVRDKVKEQGGAVLSVEGEDTGEWVLVDLGDMIVHIMQPAIREYYRLEEIWGDKEVKLGAAKRLAKRSPAPDGEAPKKASRHLAITQTASDEAPKKRVTKKPAADSGAAAPRARKVEPKAPAAKKAAPKTTVAKKPAGGKSAADGAGPTSPTVKKTPARRAPAKAKTTE